MMVPVFFKLTCPSYPGWWFQIFLFSPLPGEMIQFDEHIFQMGWNHQPASINQPGWFGDTIIFGNSHIHIHQPSLLCQAVWGYLVMARISWSLPRVPFCCQLIVVVDVASTGSVPSPKNKRRNGGRIWGIQLRVYKMSQVPSRELTYPV